MVNKISYSNNLDPDLQVSTEEWIATKIFDYPNNDQGFGEEEANELGREILYHVLRTFRPDLFIDRQR